MNFYIKFNQIYCTIQSLILLIKFVRANIYKRHKILLHKSNILRRILNKYSQKCEGEKVKKSKSFTESKKKSLHHWDSY